MSLKQRIEQDLKTALLAGDEPTKVMTLRGIKSAILNEEVAKGLRAEGLAEEAIMQVLSRESKRRQESADLYVKGGNQTKAQQELTEKSIIDAYLPQQLTESELKEVIEKAVTQIKAQGPQAMGQVIGLVKQEVGVAADGGLIARLVKERLGAIK